MGIRRKGGLKPTGRIKRGTRGLRASGGSFKPKKRISKLGKSSTSKVKREIQAQLRLNAIARDKTCVISQHLEDVPDNWKVCGKYRKDGQLIVQAEHLCGRVNSQCFANMDNIVLVCMRHHFYFKTQRAPIYWSIIQKHIGEERWAKVQAWEKDNGVYRYSVEDWRTLLQSLL